MAKNSVFCTMSIIRQWLDFILHINSHLKDIVNQYHGATYAILAAIIFSETGLIILPFLPGDSLLFAAGALSADDTTGLNMLMLILVCFIAAFIGNMVNYQTGRMLGSTVLERKIPFLNKEYIERTHKFFNKYGGATILISRFMPFIRTIAPFVAGVGKMRYIEFIMYNALGGALWVSICIGAGFKFGAIPFVQKHFEMVVIGIILISLLPAIIMAITSSLKKHSKPGE